MAKSTKNKTQKQAEKSIKSAVALRNKTAKLTRKEAANYRHQVEKLQRKGLLGWNVSRSAKKPSKTALKRIQQYKGVLEGWEQVVLVPQSFAESLQRIGARVVSAGTRKVASKGGERERAKRVVLKTPNPKTKIKFNPDTMRIEAREPTKNGVVYVTSYTAWNSENLKDFIDGVKDGTIDVEPGKLYGFKYYGNDSYEVFATAKGLVAYLEKYDLGEVPDFQSSPQFQLFIANIEYAQRGNQRKAERSSREKQRLAILKAEKRSKKKSSKIRIEAKPTLSREELRKRETERKRVYREIMKSNNAIAWIETKRKNADRMKAYRAKKKST